MPSAGRVVGIEPGDAYRQEDQRRGLDVYASLEGLKQSGQYPCDLVSLIHVLEHLPNPVLYLVQLRQELLKPNGWLLLEVPNLYAHDCFEVAHLASFSAHTLVQTLKQAGFEIVALRQHGAPRSRLLPLYITVLARPLPQPCCLSQYLPNAGSSVQTADRDVPAESPHPPVPFPGLAANFIEIGSPFRIAHLPPSHWEGG